MSNRSSVLAFVASMTASLTTLGSATSLASSEPLQKIHAPLSEYVKMPGAGWMHKSCVHRLPKSSEVTEISENGDIIRGGKIIGHNDECPYGSPQGAPPPTISGWSTGVGQFTPAGFYSVITDLTVPAKPACTGGCSLANQYYWVGVQPSGCESLPLLQVVLSYDGFNDEWDFESWYVDLTNTATMTDTFEVDPGDTVGIEMVLAYDYSPTMKYWKLNADDYDQPGHNSAPVYFTNNRMQTADLGIFEGSGISSCDQLPSSVLFWNFQLWDGTPSSFSSVPFVPSSYGPVCLNGGDCSTLTGSCSCSATVNQSLDTVTLAQSG